MEPVTTLTVGGLTAYLSKDGVAKLLGPTADYLGEGLKDFTKKRIENIGRIFQKAESRLGKRIESVGEVPPKVLKIVLNEGSFSNDELAIEYLGGILASSRTEKGRDDRGAGIAKVLDSLSTYQLRAHYLIYSTIRELFIDKGLDFDVDGLPLMQVFIPINSFIEGMDFNTAELNQINQLIAHIFNGLYRDSLIDINWQCGSKEHLMKTFPKANNAGIIYGPSSLGVELYLWAFGHSDKMSDFIFDKNFSPAIDGLPKHFRDAIATRA